MSSPILRDGSPLGKSQKCVSKFEWRILTLVLPLRYSIEPVDGIATKLHSNLHQLRKNLHASRFRLFCDLCPPLSYFWNYCVNTAAEFAPRFHREGVRVRRRSETPRTSF